MTSTPACVVVPSQPALSGLGLGWAALLYPVQCWQALAAKPDAKSLVIIQALLLAVANVIAAPAYADLDRELLGVTGNPLRFWHLVWLILSTALAVAISNGLLALLLAGAFRLVGFQRAYRELLAYSAALTLPLAFGMALGKVVFALAMPLSRVPAEVIAWHLRPFSLGLATLLPHPPPALSLGWTLLAWFDAFCIWSLLLAVSGLGPFLKAPRPLVPWLALLLVLVFTACGFGLWQAGQAWRAAVG